MQVPSLPAYCCISLQPSPTYVNHSRNLVAGEGYVAEHSCEQSGQTTGGEQMQTRCRGKMWSKSIHGAFSDCFTTVTALESGGQKLCSYFIGDKLQPIQLLNYKYIQNTILLRQVHKKGLISVRRMRQRRTRRGRGGVRGGGGGTGVVRGWEDEEEEREEQKEQEVEGGR